MSVFDNPDKDNLEMEIRLFLEEHTITELFEVIQWCVESKEDDYINKCDECPFGSMSS